MFSPPGRRRPSWKRLGLEYVAMVLAYVAVWLLTGNLLLAIGATLVVSVLVRLTRPKVDDSPPR